jgi:signal transduction histidine kinase
MDRSHLDDVLDVDDDFTAALVGSLDVGVMACDSDGRLRVANHFVRRLFRVEPHAGEPLDAWNSPTTTLDTDGRTPLGRERWPLVRALHGETVQDIEFIVASPGSIRRWVVAHARPIRAADGTFLGAVAILHDITRLRESELNLRAAHAELEAANVELTRTNGELESFAGVVSHDLKSPLATIQGYVQLLAHAQPEEFDEFVGEIARGVENMRRLIDDLLAYASAPSAPLRLAPVDLTGLVDTVVADRTDVLRRTGRPVPEIAVDPLPGVVGDVVLIRQVIENLVGNALKYTPPGQQPRVHVSGFEEETGWVRIEVADRGIGIPDGQHEHIFESFHRAHRAAGYPGTGLGLTICQRIVHRHGGTIGALPNPGGGTRFWLTLPAAATTARTPETIRTLSRPAA